MTTLIVLSTAAAPLLAIVGLFRLAGRIRERRRRSIARQIALTDEIHRELGAAAAPFVHQRGRSGWLVRVAVPLDSPPTVAAIVGIIQAFFAPRDGAAATALEIVLTPRAAIRRPAMMSPARRFGPSVNVRAPRVIGAAR
ncbi:MAG: hypothetical protein Q8Q58_06435 [Candidatus Rokubacteria bacterium]|nr:hypothetical protein [Candidatus Rokubacteria bacterium]